MPNPRYPNFEKLSDAKYFGLLLSGDQDALLELNFYYYPKITEAVRSLYGILQNDAEDVAIDVVERLRVRIPQLNPLKTTPKSLQQLIFKIIKDTTTDHYRKKLKRKEISLTDAEAIIPGIGLSMKVVTRILAGSGVTNYAAAVKIQQQAAEIITLRKALPKIGEEHQKIIWQICGMSRKQIAQQEGISVAAVDQRYGRALAELRRVCVKVKAHARRR